MRANLKWVKTNDRKRNERSIRVGTPSVISVIYETASLASLIRIV